MVKVIEEWLCPNMPSHSCMVPYKIMTSDEFWPVNVHYTSTTVY